MATIDLPPFTVPNPIAAALQNMVVNTNVGGFTTLAAPMTNGATTATVVVVTTEMIAGASINIAGESRTINSISGNVLTLAAGAINGTSTAVHAAGVVVMVQRWKTSIAWMTSVLQDAAAAALDQFPTSTVQANKDAIATALAAIAAEKATALG